MTTASVERAPHSLRVRVAHFFCIALTLSFLLCDFSLLSTKDFSSSLSDVCCAAVRCVNCREANPNTNTVQLATAQLTHLCRYPRPAECGHDNGNAFMGEEFQELLISYGIVSKPKTVKNPTAQSLVERLRLTMGDQLRATVYSVDGWQDDVNTLIQAIAWALRTAVPSNAPYSPGQIACGMDMIMRLKCSVNWQLLKEKRRHQRIANNAKENKNRLVHQYNVGDLVLIVDKSYERAKKAKLSSPTEGPY